MLGLSLGICSGKTTVLDYPYRGPFPVLLPHLRVFLGDGGKPLDQGCPMANLTILWLSLHCHVGAQNKGEKYDKDKELDGAPGGLWEGGILHFLSLMESGLRL